MSEDKKELKRLIISLLDKARESDNVNTDFLNGYAKACVDIAVENDLFNLDDPNVGESVSMMFVEKYNPDKTHRYD